MSQIDIFKVDIFQRYSLFSAKLPLFVTASASLSEAVTTAVKEVFTCRLQAKKAPRG